MVSGSTSVIIRGGGVAAWCSAFLLQKAGFHVNIEKAARATVPAILLSNTALALLRDIFQQPEMFATLPEIRKRVVAWGAGSRPVVLEHSGIVISEQVLLDTIRSFVRTAEPCPTTPDSWLLISARPLPQNCHEYRYGTRTGSSARVRLRQPSLDFTCWVESVEDGWLFLIQDAEDAGWLLGVGGSTQALLAQSSAIKRQIEEIDEVATEIPVCPRLSWPVTGPRWLACGTAAVAFDPICGDGTAHAIREAILASAVIRAAAGHAGETPHLLTHYEQRLVAAFRKHLLTCIEFYKRGHTGAWWESEASALQDGVQQCDTILNTAATFRYRLEGFELRLIGS